MTDILIRDVKVLPMTVDGVALEGYDVAIQGRDIAALGPTGTLGSEAGRIIEGRGRVLLPGLVNTHTHMGQTLFRAPPRRCCSRSGWTRMRPSSGV